MVVFFWLFLPNFSYVGASSFGSKCGLRLGLKLDIVMSELDERTCYVSNLHDSVTQPILEELFTQVY